MENSRKNRFRLESLVAAINSLMAALGGDPQKNAKAVLRRTCELLKCECAVYACIESDSGHVGIRCAHNLPPSAAAAWELAREICRRIICAQDQESVCTFSFPEIGQELAVQTPARFMFKSAIGCPIKLSWGSGAALTVLDSQARAFDEEEQLMVAVSGMLLAVEELRRQREEASRRTNYVNQKLSPMEIKVADLIRQGKVSKEIAKEFNLTVRSVEVHRYHMRKKLGLGKMKTNLQRYLALNA